MVKEIDKEAILILLKSYFECIEKIDNTKIKRRNFSISDSEETLRDALKAQCGVSSESLIENLKIDIDSKTKVIKKIHLNLEVMKYLSNENSYQTESIVPVKQMDLFFKKRLIKIYDKIDVVSDSDIKDLYDFVGGVLKLQKWEKNQAKKIVFNNTFIFIIIAVVVVMSIIGMCDGGTFYRGVRVN